MSRSHHQTEKRSNKRAKISRCQDCNYQTEKKSNKRIKSHHISEGTFLSKIFGLHHCSANEYTNTYCLSPSVLVKKKMKVPKGSKYQDRNQPLNGQKKLIISRSQPLNEPISS